MTQRRSPILKTTAASAAPRRAFTLIELMVSIALVLILILGVNQVFKITSDTIGMTNAVADKTRDDRAAAQAMTNDFRAAVTDDAPFMVLESSRIGAFRNRADFDADRDGNPLTMDRNGDNDETDTTADATTGTVDSIHAYEVNARSHRADLFNFFASDYFKRQTGNDGTFSSNTAATEAWITYGHLKLYRGTGDLRTAASFKSPGETPAADNPTNYFASDWILGRVQMLLLDSPPDANTVGHYYRGLTEEEFQSFEDNPSSTSVPVRRPFAYQSTATQTGYQVLDSRFDLAQSSIFTARRLITAWQSQGRTDWWDDVCYRYWGNPLPAKPMTSQGSAHAVPVFLRGCTQFIVEFAGDYLTQNDETGAHTPSTVAELDPADIGDGKIDYILSNGFRRIRWYGYPRDVASPLTGADATKFKGTPDGLIQASQDVVPVSDVFGQRLPFEQQHPTQSSFSLGSYPTTAIPNYLATTPPATSRYVCAWGPRELYKGYKLRPQLVRITIVLDEPGGKLSDGQTYEYIFKLGL